MFLDQMRAASTRIDTNLPTAKAAFCNAIDAIGADGALDEIYPRHQSLAADARIERLVGGLEDVARLQAETEVGRLLICFSRFRNSVRRLEMTP